jgi:hypothetical protein
MQARICLLLVLAFGFNTVALAQVVQAATTQQRIRTAADGSTQLREKGSYVNRDGVVMHSPAHTASGATPPGASAQCQDGSYSFSLHHRGTCSHHGGVVRWIK